MAAPAEQAGNNVAFVVDFNCFQLSDTKLHVSNLAFRREKHVQLIRYDIEWFHTKKTK